MNLVVRAGCSYDSAVKTLKCLEETYPGIIGEDIPSASTVANWGEEIGLLELLDQTMQAKEGESVGKTIRRQVEEEALQADAPSGEDSPSRPTHPSDSADNETGSPYSLIMDESLSVGSQKFLVALAIDPEHHGSPLTFKDVEFAGIHVGQSHNSEFVKEEMLRIERQLKPGESQTLTMKVDNYGIASYNEAAVAWQAPAGTYKVHFGASVADIRATADYKLKKAQSWPVHDLFELNEPLNEITVTRK